MVVSTGSRRETGKRTPVHEERVLLSAHDGRPKEVPKNPIAWGVD
jgi:hypothetical protein